MNRLKITLLAALLILPVFLHGATATSPFPNESLDYVIQWPSGISLGEAHWKATNTGTAANPAWEFSMDFAADIPAFPLSDTYHSAAAGNYCTLRLGREIQHGSRKSSETTEIDTQTKSATRKTAGGGESTFDVPDCVRDALTFLFFTRQELVNGHVPSPQTVLLGSPYQVKASNLGDQRITVGGHQLDAERVGFDITGPASNTTAEVFFAKDAVRTPLRIRIPLPMGAFSLELAR